jgi:restriction system protein
VSVQTVRELVAAKRNHDCILSLFVTTSDLTGPAKKEAEQFKVDYWHGGVIEQKLKAWGKWQPGKKVQTTRNTVAAKTEIAKARKEVAAAGVIVTCTSGAQMLKRKSRQGTEFWGCSKYPSCRHTNLCREGVLSASPYDTMPRGIKDMRTLTLHQAMISILRN